MSLEFSLYGQYYLFIKDSRNSCGFPIEEETLPPIQKMDRYKLGSIGIFYDYVDADRCVNVQLLKWFAC